LCARIDPSPEPPAPPFAPLALCLLPAPSVYLIPPAIFAARAIVLEAMRSPAARRGARKTGVSVRVDTASARFRGALRHTGAVAGADPVEIWDDPVRNGARMDPDAPADPVERLEAALHWLAMVAPRVEWDLELLGFIRAWLVGLLTVSADAGPAADLVAAPRVRAAAAGALAASMSGTGEKFGIHLAAARDTLRFGLGLSTGQ
jgi:hypothetical protein